MQVKRSVPLESMFSQSHTLLSLIFIWISQILHEIFGVLVILQSITLRIKSSVLCKSVLLSEPERHHLSTSDRVNLC